MLLPQAKKKKWRAPYLKDKQLKIKFFQKRKRERKDPTAVAGALIRESSMGRKPECGNL